MSNAWWLAIIEAGSVVVVVVGDDEDAFKLDADKSADFNETLLLTFFSSIEDNLRLRVSCVVALIIGGLLLGWMLAEQVPKSGMKRAPLTALLRLVLTE